MAQPPLQPDQLASMFADMDRRLRVLESTQRVGLNQLRFCTSTGSAAPTTFGAGEYGTAGNTWVDDTGATGTGYPTISMRTPNKVLVLVGYRPINLATAATFRTFSVQVNVRIDATAGYLNRQISQYATTNMDAPYVSAGVIAVGAGVHSFTIGAAWDNTVPAAATQPQLTDAYLIVLPLSAA